MRHRRHPMTTAALVICLNVLAACGGSARSEFKTGYAAARAPLNRTFDQVAGTLNHPQGKSVTAIAQSVRVLAGRFGRELAPLEALKAPADVATAFRTLTSSLKRVERDLRGAYVALDGRNLASAELALENVKGDEHAATDAAIAVTQKLDHK